MYSKYILIVAIGIFCSCGERTSGAENQMETNAKDTCADPDAPLQCNFVDMPENLGPVVIIAPDNEPGERMVISGHIYKADGKTPMDNVIMYFHHTDHTGIYSKKGDEKGIRTFHGHLHGWCKTDANGYYEIRSVRPAQYPEHTMPAHIHAILKQPDGEMYWINDFVFAGDDLVTEKYLNSLNSPGGTGIVELNKDGDTWKGTRDITINR